MATATGADDVQLDDAHPTVSTVPQSVLDAGDGKKITAESEIDATAWFLSSADGGPTEEELEPTVLRVNVGTTTEPKRIAWKIVPLPEREFRRFRKMAMGNRQQRRAVLQGDPSSIDDALFHRLVVTAATVDPDLVKIAGMKGVGDPSLVLEARFAAKPGIITQISGYVSDISGNDPDDVELTAGNS